MAKEYILVLIKTVSMVIQWKLYILSLSK